jgi:D-glycero-D-manno-heptose 1,7-bisphosphate phosphatase
MGKAAFIDRDGVINNDTGHYYIYKPDDFVLNDGVVEGLGLLVEKGYELVLITNQGGISKGEYEKGDVESVHALFERILEEQNIRFSEIYYCPHHTLKENCLCRKPKPIMIEKALARFGFDKASSFMIGDNPKDVEAATNAGIRGYLIPKNSNFLHFIQQNIDL